MNENYVTLGQVCDKGSSNIAQKDLAEREGQYPIYGAAGLIKNVDFAHQKQPYIAVVKDGAGIGRVMKLPAYSSVIGTMQYIFPKENVDIDYLFYALQHMNLGKYFSGSTIPHIYFRDYQKERLKLPVMEVQQRQADTLSRIDAISAYGQRQIALMDEIVKSRFVEMFGTYPNNPMKWETGRIRDIVADVRYGSSRPAVEGGKYSYLRMNNITYGGELDLSDTKHIDVPENELEKCIVRRGDVLFNRTNSKELVGKTCVYNRNEMMVLAGFIIRVRVTERVLPEFLSAFLNTDFSKQMLLGMCKAAIGQANINAQELQDIGLYLPPVELQHQFVHFKAEVDKSKFRIQKSLSTSRKLWTMAQIDAIMNMDFSTQRSL